MINIKKNNIRGIYSFGILITGKYNEYVLSLKISTYIIIYCTFALIKCMVKL